MSGENRKGLPISVEVGLALGSILLCGALILKSASTPVTCEVALETATATLQAENDQLRKDLERAGFELAAYDASYEYLRVRYAGMTKCGTDWECDSAMAVEDVYELVQAQELERAK